MYVNSNIPEYVKGDFVSRQYALNDTDRLIWELLYHFRKINLNKKSFILKYGDLIEHPMDKMIKIFLKKQYVFSKKDISLTWNGIVNIRNVEKIINNILGGKKKPYETHTAGGKSDHYT